MILLICFWISFINNRPCILDGVLYGVNLEFVQIPGEHTGLIIADEVISILKTYGLEKKIIGVVVDNARSNDVGIMGIAEELNLYDKTFPTPDELH